MAKGWNEVVWNEVAVIRFRARFLNSALIEKMFEGPETFVIGNDNMKRCNIHGEKMFVLAKEIKVAKNFKCVLAVLNV